MKCLINYEFTDLNILYFCNFHCQSPGLSNLGACPSLLLFHLHENQEIKGLTSLTNFFISNIFVPYFGFFDLMSVIINISMTEPKRPTSLKMEFGFPYRRSREKSDSETVGLSF